MARKTAFHVLAEPWEEDALRKMAEVLRFPKPSVALRELGLAVAGDENATARVAPFLRDFRARLAALDQEGR